GELVAPGEREDGIAVAPEDERGCVDFRVAFELPAAAEGSAVAVEAAANGTRLGEGLDVFADLLVGPEVLVVRPMRKEMAEVQLRRSAAGADEVFRPGKLVKELVPDLRDVPGLHPAHADPGIRRVEEHKSIEAVAIRPRELLDPDGAEVVRDDVRFLPAQMVERSEEHTSELQSPDHLVCRLLLEKK